MSHCETCTCQPGTIRPDGCVCDAESWPYDLAIAPPICDSHKGDPHQNCEECEHDSACHAPEVST